MSLGELFQVLGSGNWNALLGSAESQQIDFKKSPYQLAQERQKWELAKDVAAFANATGGVIVIGAETVRHMNEVVEAVVSVRPVTKASLQPDQYRDVIDRWVLPRPGDVKLHWFPADPQVAQGIFVVEVPSQPEHARPFLIRRSVDCEGTPFEGVAQPTRDGARVVWESPEELQRQLADRRRLLSALSARALEPSSTQAADSWLDEAQRLQGWQGLPVVYLQAMPDPCDQPVPGLYEEIPEALRNPPLLRDGGFAWRWRRDLEVLNAGPAIRDPLGLSWVAREGFVTEGHVVAPDSVLGWFYNQELAPEDRVVMHPLALIEITLEFCRFVGRELQARLPGAVWRYRVRGQNLRAHGIVLPHQHPASRDAVFFTRSPGHPASADSWQQEIRDQGSPQRTAYAMLVEIYALFGLPPTAIPYVEEEAISERLILDRRG